MSSELLFYFAIYAWPKMKPLCKTTVIFKVDSCVQNGPNTSLKYNDNDIKNL